MDSLTCEDPEEFLWGLELDGMRLELYRNRHGIDLDLGLRDCEHSYVRLRLCERHARELATGLQTMVHFLDGSTEAG